ncbi:MAG: ABC transporter permease [Candidatus Woesearchaeota archaeon]|nr:ABC transporter permease [Candidatus Woesearchaeota archaeon]
MKKVLAIMGKNFKLLTRSKSSALIIVLGPLLLIMLIGAAFNTANVYGVRIGTYSPSYSALSNSLIDELGKQKFTVQKIESQEACIDGIKRGIIHVCTLFPADLSLKEGGDIVFYVDNSRMNLVYMVLDALNSVIGTKTKEISTQLTKGILDTVEEIDREITDKSSLVNSLATDNEDVNNRINTIIKNMQEIDTEFSVELAGLDTFEEIAGNNDSVNEEVRTAVDKIKKELDEIDLQFKAIISAKEQTLLSANNIKTTLASDFSYINAIDNSIGKISSEIRKVKSTSVGKIVSPLSTKIEPVTSEKTQLNYVFPTLMILIVMFVSMMLASTLEITEKTSRVYLKNFITPTSYLTFLVSNFITNILVVLVQLAVIFGVAFYFFKEHLLATIGSMTLVLVLITTVFILLGMIIGSIFKSEETGAIATISIGFVFLFFSSSILPIETLPNLIRTIASFNPFFMGETLINKILLFQLPLTLFTQTLYILGGYIVGLMITLIIVKRLTKRSF